MKADCLRPYLARGVYQAEDEKRDKTMAQVIFTRRTWRARVSAKEFALPGGKIEPQDFLPLIAAGFLTQDQFEDSSFTPTEEQIIMAARHAVIREFLEELGPGAAAMVAVGLIYIGQYETLDEVNNVTWISHVFAKSGSQKMTLLARGDDDGVVWECSPDIRNGDSNLSFLAGQLEMTVDAIDRLDELRNS